MIPSPKDFESIDRNHGQVSRRLRSGGGGLRAELRSECLGQPPPLLPDFAREPLNPKKETGRCGTMWDLEVGGTCTTGLQT